MAVFLWITTHWLDFLQSIGIVSGFVFTAHSIRREAQARQISNLIELTKQHDTIWNGLARPELSRICDKGAALDTKPLSHEEQRFVTALILHLDAVYRAKKTGMFVKVEGMEKDINEFFALPVPKAVWHSVKSFHNLDFVRYVENCMALNR